MTHVNMLYLEGMLAGLPKVYLMTQMTLSSYCLTIYFQFFIQRALIYKYNDDIHIFKKEKEKEKHAWSMVFGERERERFPALHRCTSTSSC